MEESKEKFKQFVIEQLKDYDEWREASTDGYAEIITDEAVKLFCQPAVMLSLPSQDEIDEQIDKYSFRVPYDGSNNFYDEVALKHYKAGIEWLLGRIQDNGA